MNRNLTLPLILAVTGLAALGHAQNPLDTRAAYEPMFLPSGPLGHHTQFKLLGGLPPVLGAPTTMHVTAPGFLFGGVIASFGAHVAQPLPLGNEVLDVYVDLSRQLGTISLPLQGGAGVVQTVLPPDRNLVGLDLAWQAYGIDQSGRFGASNLLASNLGFSPGFGAAVFASFTFGPVNISGNSYYESNNKKQAIICNETAGAVNYTITGTKPANSGPLELRDATGAVVATVAYADTVISKTITVPAGGKIYFYNNRGAAMNGVTWSIQAH